MCSGEQEIKKNRTVTQHDSDGVGSVITLHFFQIDVLEALSNPLQKNKFTAFPLYESFMFLVLIMLLCFSRTGQAVR
jgi:hypothetical protein